MEPEASSTSASTVPETAVPSKAPFIHVASACGAFIVAVGLVYGFLTWSSPAIVNSQTQRASAVVAVTTPFDSLKLQAQAAFVVDLAESKILYAHNADIQLPLASITKVALVLAVSEVLDADDTVIISEGAVQRGEGGGLNAGDSWRVQDLIDFTLVASSNAGAEALAEAATLRIHARRPRAPDDEATVWRMNMLAQELGLTKTYFLNPSGLDVSRTQPGAMSSARDASILLAYAYNTSPEIFAATRGKTVPVRPQNGPQVLAANTNDAIADIPGLIIGKTGFTDLAGGNLSIVFETSGRKYVATVLGSSQDGRFSDMLAITDAAVRYSPHKTDR